MATTSSQTQLSALHAHYVGLINSAVSAGRMDLVEDLSSAYEDEALDLLLTLEGESDGTGRPVEYLELGGWPSDRPTGRTWTARFRRWRAARN